MRFLINTTNPDMIISLNFDADFSSSTETQATISHTLSATKRLDFAAGRCILYTAVTSLGSVLPGCKWMHRANGSLMAFQTADRLSI